MAEDAASCACAEIGDFGVLRMSCDGFDQRVLASFDIVKIFDEPAWWLVAARCRKCVTAWMVARESRVHDNHYLRRISSETLDRIISDGDWPDEFLSFEKVIKLGPDNQQVCRFASPEDLTHTVKELLAERSDISASELGYLLCLDVPTALRLMERAERMTWTELEHHYR